MFNLKKKSMYRMVGFFICLLLVFYSSRFELVLHASTENDLMEATECRATLIIDSSWESGYQGRIEIANNSTNIVSNWKISFYCEDSIYSVWNGTLVTSDGGMYEIECVDWNQIINPGETVEIGLCATGVTKEIKNITIYKEVIEVEEENENGIFKEEFSSDAYSYSVEKYIVQYLIKDAWDEYCNVEITITNVSENTIDNWNLCFESEDIISGEYGAVMMESNGRYYFDNLEYNQDILAGESITFGFKVDYGEKLDIPQEYTMVISESSIEEGKFIFENVVTNQWNEGYTGEIYITNNSEVSIEDWYLVVESQDIFINVWNAVVEELGKQQFGFINPSDKQNILPGETICIGYQASGSVPDSIVVVSLSEKKDFDMEIEGETSSDPVKPAEPTEEKFIGIKDDLFIASYLDNTYIVDAEMLSLEGHLNKASEIERVTYEVADAMGNVVLNGDVLLNEKDNTKWIIPEFGLAVGYNDVVFHIKLIDEKAVDETIGFINLSSENMQQINVDLGDNDEDGINNYYENFFGTDINLYDTDGDSLSDYEEIICIGTDPTKYDTDGNGVSDGKEDFDKDGLVTIEEIELGTSVVSEDSDGDGLSDGDEISISLTNPILYDTDEDSFADGEELQLGLNPMKADSDDDGIIDGEESILQSETLVLDNENTAVLDVTVNISAKGSLEGKVFVENTYETDKLSRDVVGLVGCPINIETFIEFDTAEIVFSYDESLLGETNENNLCIMWYDEENKEYKLLENSVCNTENNTVSCVTTHFSTYLLVDKQIWLDVMRQNIDYNSYTYTDDELVNYDIIIALDYTMTSEEVKEQEEIANNIIDGMIEGDRILIFYTKADGVSARYTSTYALSWATNKDAAREALNPNAFSSIFSQNYILPTGAYDACTELAIQAVSIAMPDDSENEKLAFVFYSGNWYNENNGTAKFNLVTGIDDAIEEEIKIHTISLGENTNDYMDEEIRRTYGQSFVAKTLEELKGLLQNYLDVETSNTCIVEEFDYHDTDGDGLYDTYEINGMRIQNGTVVYTDPFNADSDNDGLSDYQEMGGIPTEWIDYTEYKEYVCVLNRQVSDPNDANSTDKKLKSTYMIVDNVDYIPYSEKTYNYIYFLETGETDSNGRQIYGQANIWNSNPNEMSQAQINMCVTRTIIQCDAGYAVFPWAAKFLLQYIGNTEPRYYFDGIAGLFGQHSTASLIGGSKHENLPAYSFGVDVYGVSAAAMEYLEAGESACFTLKPEVSGAGVNYSLLETGNSMGRAIGSAETRFVAQITYDGENYNMLLKYYIFDYYNWDKLRDSYTGIVSDKEMYQLCRCGAARFYENWGLYEKEFVWNKDVSAQALSDMFFNTVCNDYNAYQTFGAYDRSYCIWN